MAEFVTVTREFERMCKSNKCISCDMLVPDNAISCSLWVKKHPEEAEKIIMEWSAANPVETMKDRFFKMFPNAPKNKDGTPQDICPQCLGWVDECADTEKCAGCWNRPYEERSDE